MRAFEAPSRGLRRPVEESRASEEDSRMTSEGMDLRRFVAEVLSEISLGIQDAQKATSNAGGAISPGRAQIFLPTGDPTNHRRHLAHLVSFDVALTAVQGSDSKWGIGVVAAFFGAGAQERESQQNQTVSRVRFSVPVIYPSEYRKNADANEDA